MVKGILILVVLMAFIGQAKAHTHSSKGFVEENELYIPVGDKAAGGITQSQFNKVIDRVTNLYSDDVRDKGAVLSVERKWEDGTVNAYAKQQGSKWILAMFGGLARHPDITEDGFALVVCHELGHHLGGAPKKKKSHTSLYWASNEGQSDQWAAQRCLREYFSRFHNGQSYYGRKYAEAKRHCSRAWSKAADIQICIRTLRAGKSVSNLFSSLRNLSTAPLYGTPSKEVVSKTYDGHPMPQCRLDTFVRASLCTHKAYERVSDTDASMGFCMRKRGEEMGARPLCWYRPKR